MDVNYKLVLAKGICHLPLQLLTTGGVGKDDLHVVGIDDTHDTVAGGLRLEGGNRDALTDKLIHQCRLTHVGVSHDIYESCFVHSSDCVISKETASS